MSNELIITIGIAIFTAIIGPLIVDNLRHKQDKKKEIDIHVISEPDKKSTGKIWQFVVDHNAESNQQKGLSVKVDFSLKNTKEHTCNVAIYFYNSNDESIKDTNLSHFDLNGNVAVSRDYFSKVEIETVKSFDIFMPYNEFHLSEGDYNLSLSIYLYDLTSDTCLANTEKYKFILKAKPDTGASIPIPEGKINEVGTVNEPISSFNIKVDIEVNKLKDIPCRAIAYFYYENGEVLKDLNNKYNSTNGGVACYTDFTPPFEITSYKELIISMPYDEFHVTAGNNTKLKFFVQLFAMPTLTNFSASKYVDVTYY